MLNVIRFIIVDDSKQMQQQIKKIVIKALINDNVETKFLFFSKYCNELQKAIEDTSIRTVYLLDVDLEDKNTTGIDIGKIIRKYDWDCELIFLTNHDNYFEKVYRTIYNVMDFIEKFDHMESRLTLAIKEISAQKYDKAMFTYENRQINMQIYLKDILYIEDTDRKLNIYASHNKFCVNLTICQMLAKLDKRFVQVHRSCIVNDDQVELYQWNKGSFILKNGKEVLLLSKKYKENILNRHKTK